MTHNNGVDNGVLLEGELVLAHLPMRSPGSFDTLPAEGSKSPPKIFIKVDLPQPLAPIRPYRLPLPNFAETFSKSGLEPNCMVMFALINMGIFRTVLLWFIGCQSFLGGRLDDWQPQVAL